MTSAETFLYFIASIEHNTAFDSGAESDRDATFDEPDL